MGRSLHTKLYINIIIEVKNQIYDTLIRHRYIFNLVPLDGTKNFTWSKRGKRYRQYTIWYKTVINQNLGIISSFSFVCFFSLLLAFIYSYGFDN